MPIRFGDRKKEEGVIAIGISLEWQEHLNRYVATAQDYRVEDVTNPEPGTPLKSYLPIGGSHKRIRTKEQVNQIFDYFGIDVLAGDGDFTEKFRDLQVRALLMDTQQKPVYDTLPEDWEIVDTETEVAP